MTGAACLWCTVTVFFGIAAVIIFCIFGYKLLDEDLGWKGALSGLCICIFLGVLVMLSAYQCQKCYDVNFAVAMKNINYTRTTEVNTNIEMNYQDITKDKE